MFSWFRSSEMACCAKLEYQIQEATNKCETMTARTRVGTGVIILRCRQVPLVLKEPITSGRHLHT